MTDISTYQGKVTEYKAPTGKGPHKFGIAQSKDGYEKTKKFRVWGTDYETKAPNLDVDMLQKAQAGGLQVSVSYYTKQGEYQGKTFPENYITAVEFVGGNDSSSAPAASKPSVTLDLSVLEACLLDTLDAIKQLGGAADAAPADDGW